MNKIFKVTEKIYEIDTHTHESRSNGDWCETTETRLVILIDIKTIAICKSKEIATEILYDYLMEVLNSKREIINSYEDKCNFDYTLNNINADISLLEEEKEEFLSNPLKTIANMKSEWYFDARKFSIEEVYTDLI